MEVLFAVARMEVMVVPPLLRKQKQKTKIDCQRAGRVCVSDKESVMAIPVGRGIKAGGCGESHQVPDRSVLSGTGGAAAVE